MKIILFIDNLGAGGAQRQLVGLARMLKNNKYEVEVCTYQDNNFFKDELMSYGVDCKQIYVDKTQKIRLFYDLFKYFKNDGADVVISYLERPSMIASIFKLLGLKYKLIVSERNTTQFMTRQEKIRFNLFRVSDYVVPNSHSQGIFLQKHASYLSDKIRTITNFCSFLEQKPLKRKRREIQEIIVAASIWPPKNTIGFINAVKILAERNIKFHVSWYGLTEPDDYYRQCCQLIEEHNLKNYIELLPKTKQLAQKYNEADYFCLPSFFEGTPNVLCEAICMSLPIVCSNVCDNPIYVKDNQNGFLFDPTSSEDMADKIESLLMVDDNSYNQFCMESRIIAEQTLSEDKFINQYLKLL